MSKVSYGLCFKAGEQSWLVPWGAGGVSSLEPEGGKSLAAEEGGESWGPWGGGGSRGPGIKYSLGPREPKGLKVHVLVVKILEDQEVGPVFPVVEQEVFLYSDNKVVT